MKEYLKFSYGSFQKAGVNIFINVFAIVVLIIINFVSPPELGMQIGVTIFILGIAIGNAIGDYRSYKQELAREKAELEKKAAKIAAATKEE